MVFYLGPRRRIILAVVEISHGKEFKPRLRVWFDIVDKFKWCSEFAAKPTWDLIDHGHSVSDGVEPKLAANLFFGDVGSGHLDDGAPGEFN